ncbi:MAG: flagellar basal body P-ring formation protein FlgA [Planctomycetes bacterium]|nr:flagellar basal body P-ring formation protein FlgA [Planctomycetota bacterium]
MRLFVTAMVLGALATAAGAATVRLRQSAEVASARVTLGDIAVIETTDAAQRMELAQLVVACIPTGRSSMDVRSEAVSDALEAAGLNLARVRIAGAVKSRASLAEDICNDAAVMAGARRHLAAIAPGVRYMLSGFELDFKPAENLVPVVTALRPRLAAGPVRFDVADACDPSKVVGHIFATLSRLTKVVKTTRAVSGGHILTPGDVETVFVSEGEIRGCFESLSQVVGGRVLWALGEGETLRAGCIRGEDVVKRGDPVRLEVTVGQMQVCMKTEALEHGTVGDIVRLREMPAAGRSRAARRRLREYIAKVTGPGRAVPFDGGIE